MCSGCLTSTPSLCRVPEHFPPEGKTVPSAGRFESLSLNILLFFNSGKSAIMTTFTCHGRAGSRTCMHQVGRCTISSGMRYTLESMYHLGNVSTKNNSSQYLDLATCGVLCLIISMSTEYLILDQFKFQSI